MVKVQIVHNFITNILLEYCNLIAQLVYKLWLKKQKVSLDSDAQYIGQSLQIPYDEVIRLQDYNLAISLQFLDSRIKNTIFCCKYKL